MARSEIQRRIARSKQSERDLGKWLLQNDGPDPLWEHLASSTGRVGHLTTLQFDVVSATYAGENKQTKLPAKWLTFWLQIIDIAERHHKVPLLVIEPTNVVDGSRRRIPKWHVMTAEHHAELLGLIREYKERLDGYENRG